MRASTTNNFISAGSKLFTPWTWGDKKLFDSTSVLHPATTRFWLLGITFCSIALAFIVPLVFIIIIIELEIKVFKDLGFDKLILDNLTNRMFFSHNNTYWSSWAATMYKRRNTYLSKSTLIQNRLEIKCDCFQRRTTTKLKIEKRMKDIYLEKRPTSRLFSVLQRTIKCWNIFAMVWPSRLSRLNQRLCITVATFLDQFNYIYC